MKVIFYFIGLLLMALSSNELLANTYGDNFLPTRSAYVKLDSTRLPVIFIDNGNVRLGTNYSPITIKTYNDAVNYGDTVGRVSELSMDAQMTYRGHTSFSQSPKKPYKIKLSDNAKPLGMKKDKKWSVIAPYDDKSFMRDVLTMELAKDRFEYVPKMKFFELVMNGTYYGLYVLSEKINDEKHRLDLSDSITPDGNFVGDIQVEIDHKEGTYYTSQYHPINSFGTTFTNQTISYQYKFPDSDDFAELPANTRQYVDDQISEFETAIYNDDYSHIDVENFLNYIIFAEATANFDAYRLSTSLYRHNITGNDRLWRTTLWDFNLAWGNSGHLKYYVDGSFSIVLNDWYTAICRVPFFWEKIYKRYKPQLEQQYQDLRDHELSFTNIYSKLDSLENLITEATVRNDQAWGAYGTETWTTEYNSKDLAEEVRCIKDWIVRRLLWLDHEWHYNNTGAVAVIDADDSTETETYYTLQGIEVKRPTSGLYIVRKGTKSSIRLFK